MGNDRGRKGAGRGDDGRNGGIIGGVIGVIIRGGMAGDDHCEPTGANRRGPLNPGGGVIGVIVGGIDRGRNGGQMPMGRYPRL
jgi:hypothetical protein